MYPSTASYSPVDASFISYLEFVSILVCTSWPFETSTIIIITSYPTSFYFHFTHPGTLASFIGRPLAFLAFFQWWFLVQTLSFSRRIPSIKVHVHFTSTKFIYPPPLLFPICSRVHILPQILVYGIIQRWLQAWSPRVTRRPETGPGHSARD